MDDKPPNPLLAPALIAAGGSLLGGLVSSAGQSSANKTNLRIAREQMAWNESMWNKQNAYNTPEAQIERMRQAGLNPALMYSQGNVGNAGDVHSYQAPTVQNSLAPIGQGIAQAGNTVFDMFMKNEQIKQMQAQTKLLQNRADQVYNTTPTRQSWREWFDRQSQGQLQKNRIWQADAEWFQQRNQNKVPYWDAHKQYWTSKADQMLAKAFVDQEYAKFLKLKPEELLDENGKLRPDYSNSFSFRTFMAKMRILEKQSIYLSKKYDVLETMTPAQYEQIMHNIKLTDEKVLSSKWSRQNGFNPKNIVDMIVKGFTLFSFKRGIRR